METTTAKERGVLFKGEMVRAILNGSKTMTRRIIKPQPDGIVKDGRPYFEKPFERFNENLEREVLTHNKEGHPYVEEIKCPHGKVGDVLWVRENWCESLAWGLLYEADFDGKLNYYNWKPSLFMPRAACRIRLEIADIRVERLTEISESDAIAEGIKPWIGEENMYENYAKSGYLCLPPIESYRSLWQSINGPESWDLNPFCWVISFRRID